MIQTYIYMIAMIVMTIFAFVNKYNVMGKILLILYTMISLAATITVKNDLPSVSNISVSAYLFLIIIYIIAFYPYLTRKTRFDVKKLTFTINKKYIAFAWIYIISSLICIAYFIPHIRRLYSLGNWMENRNELYSGALFSNHKWYEYCALQFTGYTTVLALVLGFALIRNREHSKLGILTLIAAAVSNGFSSIYQSSRGGILNLVLLIVVLYIFFYNDLENNKKRAITVISFAGIIAIMPYLIDVTVSRFTSSGSINSIVNYFGQPPVVFNTGVFPISQHLYGRYAFGKLFGPDGFAPSQIGGSWGTGFYTFVGWLYIDWGLAGTPIVTIIISAITIYFIQKKKYCIADLYIIFFMYYSLLQGVFVIGRNYCYNIVMSVAIYIFVKLFFDKVFFVVGNKKM